MTFRATVVAIAAGLVLTACSSDEPNDKPAAEPSERDATELVQASPLTGLAMKSAPSHPVFVVKIENTSSGAPQTGINKADVVVEELVEGGLTRLATMFYSQTPSKVGHVRSLRSTDIGVAAPVNGALVASGGAGGAVSQVKKADIELFSEDGGAPGFSSDPALSRPYNRLVNLKRLAKEADSEAPEAPFLPWAAEGEKTDPGTSKVATAKKVSVRFSRSTTTSWKLKGDTWVRTNGHADDEFKADNLIVMFAKVGDAGYTDPAGNPVPETKLEGSGRAVIMRGNQAVDLKWTKKSLDAPIRFTTADGKPYQVQPGRSYIALAPQGDGDVTVK